MRFLKLIVLTVNISFLFFGCNIQEKRIREINYLSQINIPLNSQVLNYHDNLETSIVFKIKIRKDCLGGFVKQNSFNKLDINEKHYFAYQDMLNSFTKKEKINGENLKFCKKYSTSIILNKEESIIWGITQYPVVLPDSIRAKKP